MIFFFFFLRDIPAVKPRRRKLVSCSNKTSNIAVSRREVLLLQGLSWNSEGDPRGRKREREGEREGEKERRILLSDHRACIALMGMILPFCTHPRGCARERASVRILLRTIRRNGDVCDRLALNGRSFVPPSKCGTWRDRIPER